MKKLLHEISRGENLDLYVLIFLGITLTLINILWEIPNKYIVTINVSILALMSFSLLGNRYRIETINHLLEKKKESCFCMEMPFELKNYIEQSQEILFVGISVHNLLEPLIPVLEDKLTKGANIYVLITDPKGKAIDYYSQKASLNFNPSFLSDKLENLIEQLLRLTENKNWNLYLKVIDHVFSYSVISFDFKKSSGLLLLESYPFSIGEAKLPKILLTHNEQPWFQCYLSDINTLWRGGKNLGEKENDIG